MRIDELVNLRTVTNGQRIPIPSPSEEKIISFIKTKCSDALLVYNEVKKPLYRGCRNNGSVFIGNSINNRMSKSSREANNKYFDKLLKKAGFKALRSNSIFCSSAIDAARFYGDLYYIFPLNGFSFTWSTRIDDYYMSEPYTNITINLNPKLYKNISENPSNRQPIDDTFLSKHGYRNDNFEKAVESRHEVLIHGKYLALAVEKYQYLVHFLTKGTS